MNKDETFIKSVEYIVFDDKYIPVKNIYIDCVHDLRTKRLDLYANAFDVEKQEYFKIKIGIDGSVNFDFAFVSDEEWEQRFE